MLAVENAARRAVAALRQKEEPHKSSAMELRKGVEHSTQLGGEAFGYIPAIDGLRAVAVLSVIIYHLNAALLPGGFVGVDIFFVISGFVVTGSLVGLRFERVRDLLAYFYARRLVRIMPALIVMLITTIIFTNLFVPKAWLSKSVAVVAQSAFFGVSNITLALQTDTYFAPEAAFNPFIHTWSLGVEEQFYLIFPFLFFWHSIGKLRAERYPSAILAIAAISLLSLGICAWLMYTQPRHAFYQIPARFWELGIGMLLCLTVHKWRGMLNEGAGRLAALIPAGSIALIALSFVIHETDGFPFPLAILPTLGTAGLIMSVCAWRASPLSALLSSGPFVKIGKLSYSLYLWHWPVFVLFRWTVGLDSIPTAVAALALVFLLGWLSYTFVEMPTRYNNRIKSLSRPILIFCSLGVVATSAVAGGVLFMGQKRMSLSQTSNTSMWYADGRKPLWLESNCALDSKEEPFDRARVSTWTPHNCKSVSIGRKLVVIGDSHALAYSPMFRQFAADTGTTVQMWFASGCGFMHLIRPVGTHTGCDAYYGGMLKQLQQELKPGDILFLPNLRVKRFTEQTGESVDGAVELVPGLTNDKNVRRQMATNEAIAILGKLKQTGVTVVFEAPLPLFRAAPFRCSDWFNRNNPLCAGGLTVSRHEIDELRAPVLSSMAKISAGVGGVEIWDPVPLLCSSKGCNALRDGKPLFFDGDHLSGYGNEIVYPDFRDHMKRLMKPSDAHAAEPRLASHDS